MGIQNLNARKNNLVVEVKCSLLAGGYWGFHGGKPVPFANRAPSWIFGARAPVYERRALKLREGRGGGKEKTLFPSFRASCPPPQRHLFVNYRSPRSSTSRIIQNGGHEKRTPGFLAEEKLQRLQVG